jgi:hypothetical protein
VEMETVRKEGNLSVPNENCIFISQDQALLWTITD